MKRIILHHDFETFCELDVRKVGAFKYAQHPSCEPLILTWGTTPDDLETWCPPAPLPKSLIRLARDPEVEFWAHNAQFEYCIWLYVMAPRYGAPPIAASRYRCTAAMGAGVGLPRSLDKVGAVLRLPVQKDKEGTRLIRKFSVPRKPTKANSSTRILPADDPADFDNYIQYNRTDVLVEMQVHDCVPELTRAEQRFFELDMLMNTRGLPLDMRAIKHATPILAELERRVVERTVELSGGIRPTQRDKMIEAFSAMGLDVENLQAKTIKDLLLTRQDMSPEIVEMLQLRVEGGKASTKKLKKMVEVVCDDGRMRGGFLFYGAHTFRWSGKLVQPHNFTRGEYKPEQLERLFDLLLHGDADDMHLLYERPIDAVAQGMRGFIAPPPGKKFVVSDFSAIEARVLAWLAEEAEVLAVYERNGDVYVRMAAKLYNRNEEELLTLHKAGDKEASGQRKFGKDIVLGCGYQMGGPGFHRNCAERGILIEEEFARKAVNAYRDGHPAIVRLWADVERCAIAAVETGNVITLRNLSFYTETIGVMTWFCIKLPSRYHVMRYPMPKVERTERFGRPVKKLTYRTEFKGQWVREGTYGGKLVENITQAVARDIMAESMLRAEGRGYTMIGTVHDELIAEVDEDFGSAHELEEIMRVRPKWAATAPINAEGWEGKRYRK